MQNGTDFVFMIGGEAGQGIQLMGSLLSKTFARGGFHIFADQDYESRIRGGHNFFRIRASERPVQAISTPVNMLIALNKETIELHSGEMLEKGVIVFDEGAIRDVATAGNLFGVPLVKIAEEKAGNKLMANTVALGAALGLVDYDASILEKLLREQFKADVAEANVKAMAAGFEYAKQNFRNGAFDYRFKPVGDTQRMLLNGNDALCLGTIAAGCKFVAGYPMTPSSPVLEYMASKQEECGLVVVQPEDEIAAINMIIGASYAGVRAMTATSGSGFCLMVEGLGLAGITETPIVVVDGMRPGPAVGLPTRTEQGDLEFVIHAHHGDFPRAVLAPCTVADNFRVAVKAFNLAEKYQTPVIILTDHFLATSYSTVEKFDLSKVTIDRGPLVTEAQRNGPYKRHLLTDSGVSPRAFPGQPGMLVVTDSDEHDEEGHLIEDAGIRTAQMSKRMRKMDGLRREISPPEVYSNGGEETMFVGWGSTYGAIREAVDDLRANGINAGHLHFDELWPFPAEAVTKALSGVRRVLVVEQNASGQLAHLIRAETGREVDGKILRFDGRPVTPLYVLEKVRKEEFVHGHAK